MFSFDFVFLHSLAHGCPFLGVRRLCFIMHKFCGHGSMLSAGAGHDPDEWMRQVVQLQLAG